MTKSRSISLAIILIGLFMIYQTIRIEEMFAATIGDAGPRLFPMLASAGLVICGIGKFLTSSGKDSAPVLSKEGWKRILKLFALMAIYIVAMKYLGFLVSTPVMLYLLTWLLADGERISQVRTIAFIIVVTACIYILFVKIMHVLLPGGMLF